MPGMSAAGNKNASTTFVLAETNVARSLGARTRSRFCRTVPFAVLLGRDGWGSRHDSGCAPGGCVYHS
eukprot:1985352-Pyramimonas_sp.AAC.1